MNKHLLTLFSAALLASSMNLKANSSVWDIGSLDGSAAEFALGPDGFRQFLAKDFGYEDKRYIIGASEPSLEFPYVLPGPADTWGGTWNTAGWRTHQVNILFDLDRAPKGRAILNIDLADYSKQFLPLIKVSLNGRYDRKFQIGENTGAFRNQRKVTHNEPVIDTLSLSGNLSAATPLTLSVPIPAGELHKGTNELTLTVLEGGWILFDHIGLSTPEDNKVAVIRPENLLIRSIEPADYQTAAGQPLIIDVEHISGSPRIEVKLDGKKVFESAADTGRYHFEVPMPAVTAPRKSRYTVIADGRTIASGEVLRSPQRLRTPADYVDTRIGTAHSRWMIAPGPWMPFGMVKLSPDNQNRGWQAGYQPSFENIGCFSHIHEWTLAGLGMMPAVGPLKTRVGDEQKPDEGYRSRINKRTERADIGYYSADLTDYGIKAELTATTRSGLQRYTFPADSTEGRVLIEFHPEAEYDVMLRDIEVTRVSPTRIEGRIHQLSPHVWSSDADQDYNVNFVMEFDRPMKSLGSWVDDEILTDVTSLRTDSCTWAGLFATFDIKDNPVVQVRTAISPVSIANAAENLEVEQVKPFGWDFDAVRKNQVDTWNDLFSRIDIKTDNLLEKTRFYNNMYRALCSRNIWSDVNGEWISSDGAVRRVDNPEKDVMIGCDAFWNTFWNLNQFWNLVTPEWSSKWVGSQLAMYGADGWLAKGPAGLNYIPVMVAEHEIPLIVGAYQMGIRDFDAQKALEAAVKMQTEPARKVYKGFAGNRDLSAYLKHHYVPYDKGRFSNTMEYSFDDWTVGQLAKSLGRDSLYHKFNDRGYWWRNVISPEGYCHMRDSAGNWLADFDPFRSGANQHYVEGNAWQLTFFVPQDVPALIDCIGRDRFCDRLLWGFNQDEAWRYNAPNDQYWDHPVVQGNQQSMHFAYLFNFAGQPWNTQRWSRSILDRYYGSGEGNAYLGDEDQGQMSAWAVMTALGLFQTDGGCSAEPTYEIASPLFEEVTIDLGSRYGRGKKFTIKADGASRRNIYVQSATLNGRPLKSFRFPASELLKGGELHLVMGPEPNKSWGREDN